MSADRNKRTNIFKDGEVTGYNPDNSGDSVLVTDDQKDYNHMSSKIAQAIKALTSDPTLDCRIIYGGEVTDSGSGQVDISKGLAVGLDTDGNVRLVTIPALTNIAMPTGFDDGRQLWVIGEYVEKLTSSTRNHFNTSESYHPEVEDSYTGETDTDDLFVDADPNATPDTIVCWGSFTMTSTTFAAATGRSDEFSFSYQALPDGLYRNAIINGDMQISQRNTTFDDSASADLYTLDRWEYHRSGSMRNTITQDSTVPASEVFKNSLKVTNTQLDGAIAVGDFNSLRQNILGYNFAPFVGKTATFSFNARSSKVGIYCVYFRNSVGDRSYVSEYEIYKADTWEKKIITLDFDYSGGTWDFEDGIGLAVGWSLTTGTDFHTTADTWQTGLYSSTVNQVNWNDTVGATFYLTGVQLNLGSTALDFNHKTFENNLRECQAYFEKSYDYDVIPGATTDIGMKGYVTSVNTANHLGLITPFKVRKINTPTIAWYSGLAGGAINKIEGLGTGFSVTSTSYESEFNTGYPVTAAMFDQAPLRAHFTADAEL